MSFIGDILHDVASGLKDVVGDVGEFFGFGTGSPLPILAMPFMVGGANALFSGGGAAAAGGGFGGGGIGGLEVGAGAMSSPAALASSALAPGGGMDIWDILTRRYPIPGASNPLGTALNIGSGIYGLYQANEAKQLAKEAMKPFDPYGYGERAPFARELEALRADPSRITSQPGYKAGEQAVMRNLASQGYLGSGNMLAALAEYGGAFYDREIGRLGELSGAGFAPRGPDAGAAISGTLGSADLAGRSLASIGFALPGVGDMFKRRGPSQPPGGMSSYG